MNLNNIIHYCREFGLPDPLSGIRVPSPFKADLVRSAIVVRCGLLTPVYGEPEVLTAVISDWFAEKQWTLEHLAKIIQAEYSPIENYDRYEDWTDDHTGSVTDKGSGKDIHSGEDTRTYVRDQSVVGSGQDTIENTISADNASTYQPDNKTVDQAGKTTTTTNDDTTTDTYGHVIDKESGNTRTDNLKDKHVGRMHGNIGIVTNQTMIEAELSLLAKFDPYRWIAEQFENEFMLMIY